MSFVTTLFLSSLYPFLVSGSGPVRVAWTNSHDGNFNPTEHTIVSSAAAFPTGGIVAGCTVSFHSTNWVDIAADIVRWSETGQQLWVVRPSGPHRVSSVVVDDQGAIYLGTSGDAAFHVYKLDSNGIVQWNNTITGVGQLEKIALSPNGDLIAAGELGADANHLDVLVAAFTPSGAFSWSTAIDGPQSGPDTTNTLAIDDAGEIVVTAAFGRSPGPGFDRGVIKLDASGQVLWSKAVVDSGQFSRAARLAPNGDILIGGGHYSSSMGYVARLDTSGATLWEKDWDGAAGQNVSFVDVELGSDGVVWALGETQDTPPSSDVHLGLVRYSASGSLLSVLVHSLPSPSLELPLELHPGNVGQFWATATVAYGNSPATSHTEAIAVQFDPSGVLDWSQSIDTNMSIEGEWFTDAVSAPGNQLVLTGSTSTLDSYYGYAAALDLGYAPQGYCTAKVNSLGCSPAISFTGNPSASTASGFTVIAQSEINQKAGMLLYSLVGAASTPFQGGILCLQGPLKRTPTHNSGGSPATVHDCSGSYALDMNAFAHGARGGNPDPSLLLAGTTVWCQAWGRDPGFPLPDNTSLSNGLRFVVQP
jgi:hypothetical protein